VNRVASLTLEQLVLSIESGPSADGVACGYRRVVARECQGTRQAIA
jgi:hypothetical protein